MYLNQRKKNKMYIHRGILLRLKEENSALGDYMNALQERKENVAITERQILSETSKRAQVRAERVQQCIREDICLAHSRTGFNPQDHTEFSEPCHK